MISALLQISWKQLETPLGGEKLVNIAWCLGIMVATLLLKKPIASLIARLSAAFANRFTDKKHSDKFCTLIQPPVEMLLQIILFYVAISQLTTWLERFIIHTKRASGVLALRFGDIADHIFLLLAIIFTTLILSRVADFIYHVQQDKAIREHNNQRQQLLPLLKEMVKLVLWSLGFFWLLGSVFHVNIPALITGLGIGGVAIALAAKESVENLFAAFTILTDKPFQNGDAIRLGNLEGNVERIGFRSTSVRNADGSLYIIPNKKLVNENVENLTNRDTRRVRLVVNIKYGLTHTQLRSMVDELKTMIQQTLHVIQPIEINIDSFGENVMQLTLSYYLPDPLDNGASVVDIKREINLNTYEIVSAYTGAFGVAVQSLAPENKFSDESADKSAEDDSI